MNDRKGIPGTMVYQGIRGGPIDLDLIVTFL